MPTNQQVIADVITPVIADIIGGDNVGVRAIRGWTGLENCGNLLTYSLDVGWNNGFLYGYRTVLDAIPFGNTSYTKPDVDPVNGLYQFTVNYSPNRVVVSFGANGDQYMGTDLIVIQVQGYGSLYLFWDGNARYDTTSASFTDFIRSLYMQRTSFSVNLNFTLDMDNDGSPDSVIYSDGNTFITVDENSINIDTTGDGVADIVIPR